MMCKDASKQRAFDDKTTRIRKLDTTRRCVFLFKSKTTFENATISWLLLDKNNQNVMTRWSRKCSCRRIHSLPSTQMESDVVTAPISRLRIEQCEANCFDVCKAYKHQWQPISCRRRIFGRVTSPLGDLPDFNIPPLIPNQNQQIINPRVSGGLWSRTDNLRRPFQLIPSFRTPRGRPNRFQCLQLLFVFALLLIIILALITNPPSRDIWPESPSMINAYRSEIESLKHVFPGQSGWLWFILDTLAFDLIGWPVYQSDDQIRSVIFGVPHNMGLSGSCLAWEVTKAVNRVGGSPIQPPVNFSFADIYCLDDCLRSKNEDGVARPDQEGRRTDVGSASWDEDSVEERLHKLVSEASLSGQTALFINHLQAAPTAGLDLLIRPRRHLNEHKSEPPGSLRLIFYMVHLPPTEKSRAWTVSKVRYYIVSLWPNLEPEAELLLKTQLVGNVVLVRPFSPKPQN